MEELIWSGPGGVNCVKKVGGRTLCTLHRGEGLYWLGSLLGLYERFLETVQARAPLRSIHTFSMTKCGMV